MWLVTRRQETTVGSFVKKRLLRIIPLYWLLTLFVALCATLRPNLFPVDNPTVGHVFLSLLFIPHHAADGRANPFLGQGWTLIYEMFFYAVFALTLAGARNRQFLALNVLLLGLVGYGLAFRPEAIIGISYTSPLLLEFLAGVYVCHAWHEGFVLPKELAWPALGIGLAALVLSHDFLGSATAGYPRAPFLRPVLLGLPAALILWSSVSLEQKGAMPRINVGKFLGDASYSIYLTHYLSWLALSIIYAKLGIAKTPLICLVTIAGAILGGSISYIVVERPLGRFLEMLFGGRNASLAAPIP
jgi:exopolysaccharide production protein ExoZ